MPSSRSASARAYDRGTQLMMGRRPAPFSPERADQLEAVGLRMHASLSRSGKGAPSSAARSRDDRLSRASVTSVPSASSEHLLKNAALVALLVHTSTLPLPPFRGHRGHRRAVASGAEASAREMNVLPCPSTLDPDPPRIIATNCDAIVSPRPVPPN